MADHRHHLRRGLTLLGGAVGALLMMFTMAPNALAACEDAKEQAKRPGRCVERDQSGRCTIWFDGQVYLGSGNNLGLEKEPLPPDRFKLYALVSPCDGGPAPPNQHSYVCPEFVEGCTVEDDARLYQVWSRYYDRAEPEWQPSTDWEHEQFLCVTPDQGAAHEYLPLDQPWITYVASYPGGNLKMEPPGGRTLTGLETNFYSELPKEIRYTAVHNSGPVQMCVAPSRWVWDFGDGNRKVTKNPGAPYPDLRVTHKYTETGNFQPSVSLQYSRYQNSGRGWTTNDLLHDSLPGEGQALSTVELMPRLVSPDDPQ